MPRKAKDTIENTNLEEVKKEAIRKKNTTTPQEERVKKVPSKATSSKKGTAKVEKIAKDTNSKKTASTSTAKKKASSIAIPVVVASEIENKSKTTKKSTATSSPKSKKASDTTSKAVKKNTSSKKVASKDVNPKSKKTTSVKIEKKVTTIKKVEVLEYYDLPYRYNQTVVKVLAQTPNTLFIYWDISDTDRQNYIDTYGEYFFHNTKPVLVIHNLTMHYAFEVDIHDFANSWYLQVRDSKCDYQIELGRRPINQYVSIPNAYLYISSSNPIQSPNDHILVSSLKKKVAFRNVKTNDKIQKDISSIPIFEKISKLLPIQDLYQKLYGNESFHFNQFDFKNPSSGNPTSTFK